MNHVAWIAVGFAVAGLVVACSSDSSSSSTGGAGGSAGSSSSACNTNPWMCPDGQTCWLSDMQGDFQCLNSAAGKKKGDSCDNIVGQPSCGDDMICLTTTGTNGTCVTYCDPSDPQHACAAGEVCTKLTFNGLPNSSVHACIPTIQPDAGSGGSAGSAGAAGAAGAATGGAGGAAAGAGGASAGAGGAGS